MNPGVISRIAGAIAFAEGYFVPGSRPRPNNNPGGSGAGLDRMTLNERYGVHAKGFFHNTGIFRQFRCSYR